MRGLIRYAVNLSLSLASVSVVCSLMRNIFILDCVGVWRISSTQETDLWYMLFLIVFVVANFLRVALLKHYFCCR
jgi:hypothetical protein